MQTIQGSIFVLFLLIVNIIAAAFMINEASGYYRMLYPAHLSYIAWAAAILAEIFQHLMMILSSDKKYVVRIFRAMAGMLFVLTVMAAGYHVLKPIEISSLISNQKEKLMSVLEQEIIDNRNDRRLFIDDSQRTNTAISVNERRESSKQLKKLLESSQTSGIHQLSIFEVFQLFFLRIAIQICALACAWKIGSIYRSNPKKRPGRAIIRKWQIKTPGEFGFTGVVELIDGSFIASTKNERKAYKTMKGAIQFFSSTKYAGKIPLEPTEVII